MSEFSHIEFHRHGYGMLANLGEKDPGSPVCFPIVPGGKVMTGFCNCRRAGRGKSCTHLSKLVKLVSQIEKDNRGNSWGEVFAASLWYRIGMLLSEAEPISCSRVQVKHAKVSSGHIYIFTSQKEAIFARLFDNSKNSLRFIERVGLMPQTQGVLNRADLIDKISNTLCSDEERQLNKRGVLTRRQAAEQSFWGRLVYHAFREYGNAVTFRPAINNENGNFILTCCSTENIPIFELSVPRLSVRKILELLASEYPDQTGLAIYPIPLKSIFRVTEKTKLDLEIRPLIQALQASGEARFFERTDFDKFRYGDLVYIREMNILAKLEHPDAKRRFASPVSMHLKKSRLPIFLDKYSREIAEGSIVLDDSLKNLSIIQDFDRMEITLDALKRSWYWLSIHYGTGNETVVSLAEVLQARQEGRPYIPVNGGWVNANSDVFRILENLESQKDLCIDRGKVRFSAANLLRLISSFEKSIEVKGDTERAKIMKQLLTLSPAKPWGKVKGLITPLRPYQVRGVDWLRFLFDNQLGGLLCDEMGLGKTHQAMALMVWLRERQRLRQPFLVVCPTTVISHWRDKIRDHAPGLAAVVYHGGNRKIEDVMKQGNVLLTSYGILRNDIPELRMIPFALAVFDELQNLKNSDTLSYQAASLLKARMCIGLTGTPIENSLQELKSLFDLVLPGYLGSDDEFTARYMSTASASGPTREMHNLRRLISPFTLRRLKKDVLQELPDKIDDLRTCRLSEMQVGLYREALSTKGDPLLAQLESNSEQLPYIHIFALLNLLKRICDHPALAMNKIEDYEKYESGKWELFQELLSEALDSGQKIVVFTQYLGMIAMMERLLKNLGISFVTLTGSSRNRGAIIQRFNEDRNCRIFLGSLKAGGSGIDLFGGSTVIHYDRWWNAAREDQATDRVHRIGQKQVVHVLKLVTEGTLEEKISAIIERKRQLMNTVVQADDPRLTKIFAREELIDLLRPI
jgi:superfamily II DNA or RNA helicase